MDNHSAVLVVLTTAPDERAAEELAGRLVEERLAACANIVPRIRSIYRWNGEMKNEGEALVVLKCTASVVGRLGERLAELHPYDVPEMIALEAASGLPAYLDWVRGEVEVSP